MGNSGIGPQPANESRFVVDEGGGLDLRHPITAPGQTVTIGLTTNRYAGTVDPDGFLVFGQRHIEQGTLAATLRLTVRAEIVARDAGGTLGRDGLDVEVVLHRGTGRERSLGRLEGSFGSGWQTFIRDVDVLDVRFPDDPCPGLTAPESCGAPLVPRPNDVSFVFTGAIGPGIGLTFEVDWLTLEPRDADGLAWRPVLLLHGWNATAADMQPGTAWPDGLALRDVAAHAVDLVPRGAVAGNAAMIADAVADLRARFGVQRINVLAHSKGGVDTREYLRGGDDVETLIMLATPNAGSFVADRVFVVAAAVGGIFGAALAWAELGEMTTPAMLAYNGRSVRNPRTAYVTAAGAYNSDLALAAQPYVGPNDEVVAVPSVEALPYTADRAYPTSTADPESTGICATLGLVNHQCLRYYPRIVDDLFPLHLAVLTAPRARAKAKAAAEAAEPVPSAREEAAPAFQTVMSGAALAPPPGVAHAYTAVVDDGGDEAVFSAFGEGEPPLRLELVTPSGRRIDPGTPATDPTVVHAPFGHGGMAAYTAYAVRAPEPGAWTLEVAATAEPAVDSAYLVSALLALPPGTGVVLDARADRELYAAGDAVTVLAAVTAGGASVTGATVRAVVRHPDGTTTTDVALEPADAEYAGALTDTVQTGPYAAVVFAEGAAPVFARERLVQFTVAASATAFSGTFADRGEPGAGGAGVFERLVVDVGLDVDAEATYRVLGTLTDGSGGAIVQARAEAALAPGPRTVTLAFDGAALFAAGHDGAYVLDDLLVEHVDTATVLARGPAHTTAAYARTDFRSTLCGLTGVTADRGVHDLNMTRLPFEALVVEVEVDSLAAAEVEATANLHAEDGTFVAAARARASLAAGTTMVAFRIPASTIFPSGRSGPYHLRLFNLWGSGAGGEAVTLTAADVVAVTAPYRLEEFAESPRFTVGGTVSGLRSIGQLELELVAAGPPGTPSSARLRPHNGTFEFSFVRLVGGNPYEVRVARQPTDPVQACTVTNGVGVIEDADVTDVTVMCA